jgi:hypothetical protein
VTWTNQDTAPHDVKTTSGPVSIHSPMLDKGQSWSFTFTTAGSYGYVCTVHPNMTAGITVRAAAPATTAAPTAHEHHTGAPSGHRATAPSRTTPSSRPPTMRMPSSSQSSAASGAPAAAGQSPQASPPSPAAQAAQQPQTQTTASATRPLDTLLVLTGIVAGVAVLCLLLVGSRASAPQAPRAPREEEA